jgi:hypothetical protein
MYGTYIKIKNISVYLLLFNDVRILDYSVSNVRIYCHLLPAAWLCHIFPRYLINGTILAKMLLNTKMYFDVLYSFCLKHFSFCEELSLK